MEYDIKEAGVDYQIDPTREKPFDVDGNNAERADAGQGAIDGFLALIPMDDEPQTILGDLLCNLRHWAEREGVDFDRAVENGRGHWEAETGRAPY